VQGEWAWEPPTESRERLVGLAAGGALSDLEGIGFLSPYLHEMAAGIPPAVKKGGTAGWPPAPSRGRRLYYCKSAARRRRVDIVKGIRWPDGPEII